MKGGKGRRPRRAPPVAKAGKEGGQGQGSLFAEHGRQLGVNLPCDFRNCRTIPRLVFAAAPPIVQAFPIARRPPASRAQIHTTRMNVARDGHTYVNTLRGTDGSDPAFFDRDCAGASTVG